MKGYKRNALAYDNSYQQMETKCRSLRIMFNMSTEHKNSKMCIYSTLFEVYSFLLQVILHGCTISKIPPFVSTINLQNYL